MQRLRRLVRRSSARQGEGVFVIEGAKLLREAAAAGTTIESVYVAADRESEVPPNLLEAAGRVHRLAPGVIERVADTATPQPVLGVVPMVDVPLTDLRGATFLVVCADLRDPGNAGTVLRSAEAAGADGVVCCDGSVDVYNPKTVRASAGSLFHVRVVVGGKAVNVLEDLGGYGIRRLGAVARNGRGYTATNLTAPLAFVVGNEAHGLPTEVEGMLDERVTIPMAGRAESLNAGMAATVLCFEAARQRRAEER